MMDLEHILFFVSQGLVRAVGWSMAVVGFGLSIAAPVVATVVPHLRIKPPPLLYNLHTVKTQEVTLATSKSDSLIDSLETVSSKSDEASVSPVPSPTSPSNQDLESVTVVDKDVVLNEAPTHKRHVCCPKRCAKHASTSTSSFSSLEYLNDRSRLEDNQVLMHTALTPIVSEEGEQPLAQGAGDLKEKRRRSWGLFHLKKSHKHALTQPDVPPDAQRSQSAPPSRRNSFDMSMSPARTLVSLPDHTVSDDHLRAVSEQRQSRPKFMKKPSCLRRLSSKNRGKDRSVKSKHSSETLHTGDSTHGPSGDLNDKPQKPSTKHSRKETTVAPPARTRPYEAPYFFPTPDSENARNYAQRIRAEMRSSASPPASSKSFSSNGRSPRPRSLPRSGQHHDAVPPLPQPTFLHSEPLPMHTTSAPAHKTAFTQKIRTGPTRHRKSASVNTTAELTTADEFGFITSTDGRHVRLVPERAASTPTPFHAPPILHTVQASQPRPILKHTL